MQETQPITPDDDPANDPITATGVQESLSDQVSALTCITMHVFHRLCLFIVSEGVAFKINHTVLYIIILWKCFIILLCSRLQ